MNKYERLYELAYKHDTRASWYRTAIAALAADIQEVTGENTTYSGPYGLRAEVVISTKSKIIIVTPDFSGEHLMLWYDTGEVNRKYEPNTIGDYNGFNNVTARLPDTIEKIVSVMLPLEERRECRDT